MSADRARLEQVFTNLLDNAIKYTPAGGQIRISLRPEGTNAILEISDTGLGMPPELIGRVFDLFVQGERTLAREPGGLGIGLTMVQRLVELHGGTVHAKSEGPNHGATFTVELPAIEPRGTTPVLQRPRPRRQCRAAFSSSKMTTTRAIRLPSSFAWTTIKCPSLATARTESSWRVRLAPDFVLVDIGLPDMDGYEVARRLRNNPATSRLRLIAVTGYGTQEDRRSALAAGFNEHLAKPVELASLQSLLSELPP